MLSQQKASSDFWNNLLPVELQTWQPLGLSVYVWTVSLFTYCKTVIAIWPPVSPGLVWLGRKGWPLHCLSYRQTPQIENWKACQPVAKACCPVSGEDIEFPRRVGHNSPHPDALSSDLQITTERCVVHVPDRDNAVSGREQKLPVGRDFVQRMSLKISPSWTARLATDQNIKQIFANFRFRLVTSLNSY